MTSRATPTAPKAAPSAGSPGEFSMERYDSTKRAARFLLSAGMLATAMVAITTGSASAQTQECMGETPTVCGHVFTETGVGDNTFQVGEGTGDVTVVVTTTGGEPVDGIDPSNPTSSSTCYDAQTLDCAYYYFDIPPGDYLVCLLIDGKNVACKPVTGGTANDPVDLEVPSDDEPVDAEPPYFPTGNGTGTPGYWKNHPEAWPAGGVTIGGIQYSVEGAIALMGKVSGDKTYSMFSALVAATLNTMPSLNNDYTCIAGTLFHANAWMSEHPVGSIVKGSSAVWQENAADWHSRLDDYNNGKLCAPHRK
jgi:hypothetical protein